jgi:uncharacterized protein YcfL
MKKIIILFILSILLISCSWETEEIETVKINIEKEQIEEQIEEQIKEEIKEEIKEIESSGNTIEEVWPGWPKWPNRFRE